MTDDIRIKADFPHHFKTRKLIHIAGHEGVFGLISLWCYCRTNKPKGDLSGMSDHDIEIICGFDAKRIQGAYQSFMACLHDVGFLDKTDTGYALHDWAEHQPYAFYANERSQKARESAQARWSDKSQSNAKRIPDACETHTKGNALLSSPPSPSPLKNNTDSLRLSGLLADKILFNNSSNRSLQNRNKRVTILKWSLDIEKLHRIDNQSFEDIEAVINWCQADDFWKSNILSATTLRKQWDKLIVKVRASSANGNGTSKSYDASGRVLRELP
jgi:hypothetical protein